jgi:hypothetical protein
MTTILDSIRAESKKNGGFGFGRTCDKHAKGVGQPTPPTPPPSPTRKRASIPLARRFTPQPLNLYITAYLDDKLISYRVSKDDDGVFRVLPPDGKTWSVRPSGVMTNTQTIAALTIAASIRNNLLNYCATPDSCDVTETHYPLSVRCRFGQTMCRLGYLTWPDILATNDHEIAHHLEGVMDLLGMMYNQ